MIRFLFRLMALAALAVAVILGVLDATRSVAASDVVITPLRQNWASASPDSLAAAQARVEANLHAWAWVALDSLVLSLPGFVVFAAVALLFHWIGRRPAKGPGALLMER